jgi:hypothetical protein
VSALRLAVGLAIWVAAPLGTAEQLAGLSAADVVARYVEARGGAERWRAVERLEISGTFAAFSKRSEFTLLRARGDRFRLDFELLDAPAVRARDEQGPWMLHVLLQPEAGRVTEDPYKRQLERESLFPLVLFEHEDRGIEIELVGPGSVDGVETVDLLVRLADGQEELWHLDGETFLEVAVDSEVVDHTQSAEPIAQRLFYDDFREVEGLVLPFQLEWEFGARLESMTVDSVAVNPAIDDDRFRPPAGE